jgi:hypothetical protein
LSPRELAVRFTDTAGYFVSEASVYRLLKAHDLIASPAFIVMNERWHQTLKNRILLENYYLPGDLEAQIEAFVADYNHRRYHESIDNLTPADAYFGRGQTILLQRERQTPDQHTTPLAPPTASRVTSSTRRAGASLICTARCLKKL